MGTPGMVVGEADQSLCWPLLIQGKMLTPKVWDRHTPFQGCPFCMSSKNGSCTEREVSVKKTKLSCDISCYYPRILESKLLPLQPIFLCLWGTGGEWESMTLCSGVTYDGPGLNQLSWLELQARQGP